MSETICFCTNRNEDEVIEVIQRVVKADDQFSDELVDKVHASLDDDNNGETPRCRGCVGDLEMLIKEYLANGGKL